MLKKIAAIAAALWLSIGCAFAQTSPNLTFGQVLTPAQWNQLFINKQDTLGFTALNTAGGVMTGRLVTAPPSSTTAGLNLTCGSAPANPVNGDQWCTTAGLFVRINGVTIGPLSGATASSFGNTAPITLSFPSGVVTYACPTCGVIGSPLSQFASTTSAQLAGIISDKTGTGQLVFATNPVLVTPNLGTPSAVNLLHGTALPIATGVSGLGTGIISWLATPTSANLIAAVTDETGTGSLVFANSPTLVTPNIASIVNTGTLTLPTVTDTLVARTTTDTMANKTLTSPTINAGTISGTFGGAATFSGALTLSSALTYGGVTLANSVTGTGSMVLGTSPSIASPTITTSFTATGLVTFADMATASVSTTAQYFAGTVNTLVPASVIYSAETTTTFGTTTTFDFSTFLNTEVTLTGNITTMTLVNVKAGQSGVIRFIQDGTGSRTTPFNSIFKFSNGATPTLTPTPGASDDLFYTCISATRCDASLGVNFK